MAEPNMLIPLPVEMARLMKLTQRQAEQIERLRARVFALEDAQGGDAIPLAEPRTPEAQRTPLDPVDVEELWDKANADDAADEVHHAFARLLERAHGIGPNVRANRPVEAEGRNGSELSE